LPSLEIIEDQSDSAVTTTLKHRITDNNAVSSSLITCIFVSSTM